MGSSLFGGGTSKVNSTSLQNSDTTGQSTSNVQQGTNGYTNQYGASGSNSGQNQQTAGSSNVSQWQMPYINAGLNAALQQLQASSANGAPQMSYTGLSPEQQAALGSLGNYASGTSAPLMSFLAQYGGGNLAGALGDARASARGVLSQAFSDPTQSNIYSAGQYANNPYVQGMIQAAQTPIERQLKEVAVPGLNISANRGGNMDSSRAAMTEAMLRRSAGIDEANVASGILGDQYTRGLNLAEAARTANMNAGLGATGQLAGIGNSGANLAMGANDAALRAMGIPVQVGQAYQDDANRANAVNFQNQQMASQYPWQNLQQFWNIVGRPLGTETTGTGSQSGYTANSMWQNGAEQRNGYSNTNQTASSHTNGITNTSGTQTQPGPGILGGTLGALSGIGSLFADGGLLSSGGGLMSMLGMFSDRRLKTDINQIGELPNGLPVYSFRYLWKDEPQIGLMADEVEKVHPEAVIEGPAGFKMVDYAKAVR